MRIRDIVQMTAIVLGALPGMTAEGQVLLHDNGPYITGIGCGGLPNSSMEPPGTIFGNNTIVTSFHQADDFTVPVAQTWRLSTLEWILYQTDAPPREPIIEVYIQIYDNLPETGDPPTYGDMTTNRLIRFEFDGVFRDRNDASCARALKRCTIDMSWVPLLTSGTYWIEIGSVGNPVFSGPWANHKVPRDTATDNSRYFTVGNNQWVENMDVSGGGLKWDYPYRLFGTLGEGITLSVDGTCPGGGPITISWEGATPRGRVALLFGRREGGVTIPTGNECAGTVLGLGGGVRVIVEGTTGASGSATLIGEARPGACGGFMQLLDLTTCGTSNVVLVD